MLRTPSVLGPLNSGFVPFASGAPIDAVASDEAAEVIARAAAMPAEVVAPAPSAVWTPASSARIRLVEGAVVAGLCAYFGFALLRTLAGF